MAVHVVLRAVARTGWYLLAQALHLVLLAALLRLFTPHGVVAAAWAQVIAAMIVLPIAMGLAVRAGVCRPVAIVKLMAGPVGAALVTFVMYQSLRSLPIFEDASLLWAGLLLGCLLLATYGGALTIMSPSVRRDLSTLRRREQAAAERGAFPSQPPEIASLAPDFADPLDPAGPRLSTAPDVVLEGGARCGPGNSTVPVSVIIPCFDRAQLLERALKSVLDQEPAAAEVIVVDDGSTDGSAQVAEALGVTVVRRSTVARGSHATPGSRRRARSGLLSWIQMTIGFKATSAAFGSTAQAACSSAPQPGAAIRATSTAIERERPSN